MLSNKCFPMAVCLSLQCKEDISAKYFEHFDPTKPCTVDNNLLRLFSFFCGPASEENPPIAAHAVC